MNYSETSHSTENAGMTPAHLRRGPVRRHRPRSHLPSAELPLQFQVTPRPWRSLSPTIAPRGWRSKMIRPLSEVVGALRPNPPWWRPVWFCPTAPLFAQFGKAEDGQTWSNFPAAGEFRFTGGQLLVSQPVRLKKEQ